MFKVFHTEAAPYSSHEEFTWRIEGSFQMQLLWPNLKELREFEKTHITQTSLEQK